VSRLVRLVVVLGLVAAAAWGAMRFMARRRASSVLEPSAPPSWPPFDDGPAETVVPNPPTWGPVGEPTAEAATPSEAAPTERERYAAPVDGQCPDGFPIKAKLASRIYHQPGGSTYARTTPDRCYATAQDAEADGYRPAKR
jgi:micrococcal nuclease